MPLNQLAELTKPVGYLGGADGAIVQCFQVNQPGRFSRRRTRSAPVARATAHVPAAELPASCPDLLRFGYFQRFGRYFAFGVKSGYQFFDIDYRDRAWAPVVVGDFL